MSQVLLDTNVVVWLLLGDRQALTDAALAVLEDPVNSLTVSAVSVWEIAIKRARGRLEISERWFEELGRLDFEAMPISALHARQVEALPAHHRDPFDRLLIGQSLIERMPIITSDSKFARYGVEVIW